MEHSKKCRQLREQVLAECAKVSGESSNVFCLLVNTSEFELNLRSTYRRALDEREQNWQRVRLECRERLRELADYFSGESVLVKSKATKNEHLREWFIERERQVAILDLENPLAAGRLAARILESMAEALELDVISGNMQVPVLDVTTQMTVSMYVHVVHISLRENSSIGEAEHAGEQGVFAPADSDGWLKRRGAHHVAANW